MQYSPLCDGSVEAYKLYLAANVLIGGNVKIGGASEWTVSQCMDMFFSTRSTGGKGAGSEFRETGVFPLCATCDGEGSVDGLSGERPARVGCTYGGGDVRDESVVGDSGAIGAREISGVAGKHELGDSTCRSVGGLPRGPNYDRNRMNRLRKKAARQIRNNGDVSEHIIHEKKGFFSECDDSVQVELRESRAKFLIAENARRAREEERKLARLDSPEQILRDAMRMVGFANEQAKKVNDSKVCGWAKTVAESYAETIAKSAPTSVESFESFVRSNTSVTSVSLEAFNDVVKIKDDVVAELDRKNFILKQLESRISELEKAADAKKVSGVAGISLRSKPGQVGVSKVVATGGVGIHGRPVIGRYIYGSDDTVGKDVFL